MHYIGNSGWFLACFWGKCSSLLLRSRFTVSRHTETLTWRYKRPWIKLYYYYYRLSWEADPGSVIGLPAATATRQWSSGGNGRRLRGVEGSEIMFWQPVGGGNAENRCTSWDMKYWGEERKDKRRAACVWWANSKEEEIMSRTERNIPQNLWGSFPGSDGWLGSEHPSCKTSPC